MNGPKHYRIAEELLASATLGPPDVAEDGTPIPTYPALEFDHETGRDVNTVGNTLLAAQVHATLAQVATAERLAAAIENLPTYEGMLSVYAFGVNSR